MCEFRAGEKLPEEANLTVFVIDHFKPEFSLKTLYHLSANGPSDVNVLCFSVRILSVLDKMEEPSEQCETLRRTQGQWTGWGPGTSGSCVFCFLIMVLAAQGPFSGNIFHSSSKRKRKISERIISVDSGNCLPRAGQGSQKDSTREKHGGVFILPSRALVGCLAPWNSSCYAS